MKFAWIKTQRGYFPLKRMCAVLGVSSSGFYAWLKRAPAPSAVRRERMVEQIRQVHEAGRHVYGSPRIHHVLRARGESVCENTVAKLMRSAGIRSRIKRRFIPATTDSAHPYPVAANLLEQRFEASAPNRKWVADITYIETAEGWLYLSAVMDLFSRKIVGWSMADHLRTDLVAEALKMGLTRRKPETGLLHHSDRGVQYASDGYQQLLKQRQCLCSMSRRGNCYDNAAMESFWGTLKQELIFHKKYATREQARRDVFEYIEVFYNRVRIHSSLGYKSPEAFEANRN